MSKVVITTVSKDSEELLYQTSKTDLVSVRVEQTALCLDAGGFMRNEVRTDFVKLNRDLANQLVASGTLKKGVPYSSLIGQDCKIVIKESHVPFYPGMDAKKNPSTGEFVTKNGELIYRKGFITTNMEACDELIKHDSVSVNVGISANSDFAKAKS
jgi:hypothetical protein